MRVVLLQYSAMGGRYTFPSHLSHGARDLITRLLEVDPMKRMAIPEIHQHQWFKVHLPRYLAVPPPDILQQAKKFFFFKGSAFFLHFCGTLELQLVLCVFRSSELHIYVLHIDSWINLVKKKNSTNIVILQIDEKILQEVVNMGFDRNQLVESLINRVQNEGTVTYYLLLDNRHHVSSGYLGDKFQEATIDEEILQQVVNMGFDRNQLVESLSNRVQNEGTVTYYLLWDNRYCVSSDYLGDKFQEITDSGLNPIHPGEVTAAFGGQQFPVEGKRALGVESRVQPREIMDEVLKALQKLNVCSKQIGHYKMKCRWVVISGHQREMINKFELQLYKTQEKKYLLDLQRHEGPQILFSDLCAAFLVQLRVL